MNSNKPATRTFNVLPTDVKQALEGAVSRLGSQVKVAADLGISAATVNNLLRDRYPGDVDGMASRIRGQYMAETVNCPVQGVLSRRHCLDNQARPVAFTNPVRASLQTACRTCANRKEANA
jgi:hypothetical protein